MTAHQPTLHDETDQDDNDDNGPFEPIGLPTVADIEFDDGEAMTLVFDQEGVAVGHWYRGYDAGEPGAALRRITEVANLSDQRLVDRIQRCRFADGSSPLIALGIAHRHIDALGQGEPIETLDDLAKHFEILHHETVSDD